MKHLPFDLLFVGLFTAVSTAEQAQGNWVTNLTTIVLLTSLWWLLRR